MDRKEVAEILEEIATLLDLRGENPFRSNAFRGAARALEGMEEDLEGMVREGRLGEIRGVGKAIEEKITRVVTTGNLPYLDELRASVPPGILDFLRIPGLGARKARALWDGLRVETLIDLETACRLGQVSSLKGFGKKTEEKILRGIRAVQTYEGRYLLHYALGVARGVLEFLLGHPGVIRGSIAGAVRRVRETVEDVEIVVAVDAAHRDGVERAFRDLLLREEVRVPVHLHRVEEREYGTALLRRTGSPEHVQGLGEIPAARTEEEVYASLGLDFIPPEIREGEGEIEAARAGDLPDLVREEDIRGLIHVHTTWSDGRASLEEMVEAARDQGYEYIGICDHSRSAFYARGLDVDRLREQRREIEEIAPSYPEIRILHGCEVDILADGSLDYPDDILQWLDFTVASVHSGLDMAEEDQMKRILRALQNPHVTMLGHPSARLLLSREPIRISLPSVVEEAAKRGVALEINANPRRLDLDWRLLRAAKSAGALFSINPDAHSIRGISDIAYGVGIARKGWLEKIDLVNTRSVEGFL